MIPQTGGEVNSEEIPKTNDIKSIHELTPKALS